jgi:mannose-6-phosphate isomerase-like protein (cupin superfamily)
MGYIRVTDEKAFEETGFPEYTVQMLAHPESATFINSRVGSGGHAADLHVHHADQIYYVIDGEMQLELGTERFSVAAESLVFIPAGLPHRNWNEGPHSEFHFEMIVPTARPGVSMLRLVDSAEHAHDQSLGYVTRADIGTSDVMTLQLLTKPSVGRSGAKVSVCAEPAGAPGVDLHTHPFDQFYYVLEGTLGVEIADSAHEVEDRTLVALPAGVSHRSWNSGASQVRYLVVEVPIRTAPDSVRSSR